MWKTWIPNGLSLGNLCFGFITILIAIDIPNSHHNQDKILSMCSSLILIAFLFDGFDGFTARLLQVESPLGGYLDTLADLTTFGIAPSVLVYQLYLRDLNIELFTPLYSIPIGVFIAFIYPLCATYRLARFSINNDKNDKKSFVGLPSPISAALIILTLVIFKPRLNLSISIIIFLTLSFLMISNIKYTKPQNVFQDKSHLIHLSVLILITLSLIFLFGWYIVILFSLTLYTFFGLLALAFHFIQKLKV